MRKIKLTDADHRPCFIDADSISAVINAGDWAGNGNIVSKLLILGDYVIVSESVEEVEALIHSSKYDGE